MPCTHGHCHAALHTVWLAFLGVAGGIWGYPRAVLLCAVVASAFDAGVLLLYCGKQCTVLPMHVTACVQPCLHQSMQSGALVPCAVIGVAIITTAALSCRTRFVRSTGCTPPITAANVIRGAGVKDSIKIFFGVHTTQQHLVTAQVGLGPGR